MSFIDYPSDLEDRMKIAGFQTALPDERVVAQTADGGAIVRGGQAGGGAPLSGVARYTVTELARFWRWWRESLDKGRLPFRIRNQQIDGVSIATEDGAVITDETGRIIIGRYFTLCRFDPLSPPPQETATRQGVWNLAMQLRRLA